MLIIHNGILDQRGKMKNVTKIGYKTMKIPQSTHEILVKTRKHNPMTPLYCSDRLVMYLLIKRTGIKKWRFSVLFINFLYSVPFPMSNCETPSVKNGSSGELLTSNKFKKMNFPQNKKIFFYDDVLEHIRPLAEKWSKQKLSSDASIFGIRYLTGAWLSLFVAPTREKTIGVILQVRALSYSLTKAS